MLSARVYNPKKNGFGPEFDHMSLLVHLDKKYLVDVGFGDSFRTPIGVPGNPGEISRSAAEDAGGNFGILKIEDNVFDLQKLRAEGREPQYRFSTIPRKLSDFKEMCDFQQDSPTSHFRINKLCTIATTGGRITLSDNSLTVSQGGIKEKTVFDDPEEFDVLLKKYFNINLKN